MTSSKTKDTSIVSKILDTPWHFVGLTIVFIFNGYLRNPVLFEFSEVLLYAALFAVIVLVIFLVLKRVLLHHYAGLMTALLVLLFFTYGNLDTVVTHMYNALPHLSSAVLTYLPWIVTAFALLILVLLAVQKRQFVQITTLLNVIAITMLAGVILDGFNTLNFLTALQQNQLENRALNDIDLPVETPQNLPDVYYIILDGYPSNSYLAEHFGIDNSAFTGQLEELGFFIAEESLSNYTYSAVSMSSSLNMQWVQELASEDNYAVQIKPFVVDNRTARTFQEIGYDYIVVAGGYLDYSTIADLTIDVDNVAQLVYLEKGDPTPDITRHYIDFLRESTFLRALDPSLKGTASDGSSFAGRRRVIPQFEALKRIADYEQPTFTFFHIVKPHKPLVFNADGSPFFWTDEYANLAEFYAHEEIHVKAQIDYLNQLTLDAIRHILENSQEAPIIVIQGDHGMQLERKTLRPFLNNPIAIMNAYYFPDGDYSNIPGDIRPINTFRTIFNQYFNIPYEPLPNISYYQIAEWTNVESRPLLLREITEGQIEPRFSSPEDTTPEDTANTDDS